MNGIFVGNSQFLIMQMCKSLHYHSDKSPHSDSMMLGPSLPLWRAGSVARWLCGYLAIWLHGQRLLTAIGAIEHGALATSIG